MNWQRTDHARSRDVVRQQRDAANQPDRLHAVHRVAGPARDLRWRRHAVEVAIRTTLRAIAEEGTNSTHRARTAARLQRRPSHPTGLPLKSTLSLIDAVPCRSSRCSAAASTPTHKHTAHVKPRGPVEVRSGSGEEGGPLTIQGQTPFPASGTSPPSSPAVDGADGRVCRTGEPRVSCG